MSLVAQLPPFKLPPSPLRPAAAILESLQKRWDRLRGLDLILDQRGADNGRSACRRQRVAGGHYKGKEAERLVTRIDPGVVSLVAELRENGANSVFLAEHGETQCGEGAWDASYGPGAFVTVR